MSEAMKVLQLRWIESVQKMYDEIAPTDIVARHKFDEVVLVHIEMVDQFTNLLDEVEAELIHTTHTIKYVNEATAKLKEQIQNG